VLPGQPVVTVQMMDPMKIQVAVSPETDKQLKFNDRVRVYLPDSEEFLEALVYLKDTYADPATRTYLVTLLVRNQKTVTGMPDEFQGKPVATTKNLWTLLRGKQSDTGNFFVEANALHQDADGYFVWKADNLTAEQLYESFDPVLKVSKVRVKPGDARIPMVQVFTLRELVDKGDLDPETAVILGEIQGDVNDGQVVLSQDSWRLRPGDLAEVALRQERQPEGFYLPRVAIMYDGKTNHVFVVPEGESKAKRVDVRALETSGQSQRVEAIGGASLQPGDRVIVGGAHYVMDGEEVSLAEKLEAQP
jgi:multidrug efflux pump subunit AcrA (membrane-fusion protein)